MKKIKQQKLCFRTMCFKKFKLKNFELKDNQEENLFLTIPGML